MRFPQEQCVVGKVSFLESAEGMQQEITPKSTVVIRDSESTFFREIRNNSTLPLVFTRPPYI